MLADLLREVKEEADRRIPDLIRFVLDHKWTAAERNICLHQFALEYIKEVFQTTERWLQEEACYEDGGHLCCQDHDKLWDLASQVDQTQSYARVDEPQCGECEACCSGEYEYGWLFWDLRHLLRMPLSKMPKMPCHKVDTDGVGGQGYALGGGWAMD